VQFKSTSSPQFINKVGRIDSDFAVWYYCDFHCCGGKNCRIVMKASSSTSLSIIHTTTFHVREQGYGQVTTELSGTHKPTYRLHPSRLGGAGENAGKERDVQHGYY